MEFSNVELSPRASASLDQLRALVDHGEMPLADAVVAARTFVRIDNDPDGVRNAWIPLPGEPPVENVLSERVEGTAYVFVVVWEYREDHPVYVHDLGWEPRLT